MRQTFDIRGGPVIGRTNLPRLRRVMAGQGLDGVFIPHDDEYKNEYLPDANERLAWATGFTGSAGAAFIFADRAVVFTDSRYTLQAADQLDADLFETVSMPDPGPFGWLAGETLDGKSIGFDPRLLSPNDVTALAAAAEKAGAHVQSMDTNPVDEAWPDRPEQPMAQVVPHPVELAGEDSASKRERLGAALAQEDCDAAIITAPASLAWLFNIRGGDVFCTPLPLGRAILRADGSAELFLAEAKVTDTLRAHLGNGVAVRSPDELEDGLAGLKGKSVSLDPEVASAWFFRTLEAAGAEIHHAPDPCALPRACKNRTEIAGSQNAHRRDGVALTRFLHWLDTEAQSGSVTEIEAVEKLESLRAAGGDLRDISFETISGAGPNGAIVHYRVSTATNRKLECGSLFLVDSGGQYEDGTTDVTRTVAIGEPTDEMSRHYTLVLKGHIGLARVRFPAGTTGTHLDILARQALWQAGLDYGHGTGHGVGVYLGVHEGPQRIAQPWNATALAPGMIVSNEPGYYKTGAYGIRIENLQYVTAAETVAGGEIPMLGFDVLTLAPLARRLICPDMLTRAETEWVDAYHARVLEEIGPQLSAETGSWLEKACAPLR